MAGRPATEVEADWTTDRSNYDRCISTGTLQSITPKIYNSGSRIVQGPGYVVIMYEMVHEARVVPLDGRPHVSQKIRAYEGDSRGHFEGDTLVVEVIANDDRTWFDRAGNYHSDALHLTERFTLKSPDVIWYEVTIEDPNVYTRPWKIAMPLYRRLEANAQLIEYRCIDFAEEFMYGNLRKNQLVKHWESDTLIVDIKRKVPPGAKLHEWYRR